MTITNIPPCRESKRCQPSRVEEYPPAPCGCGAKFLHLCTSILHSIEEIIFNVWKTFLIARESSIY